MLKLGRNDPCPCGSGRKYKHCHLGKDDDPRREDDLAIADKLGLIPYPFLTREAAAEHSAPASVAMDDGDSEPTALDRAWEHVFEALNEPDNRRWRKRAKRALKLSADCSGAYFLDGMTQDHPGQQYELFSKAIDAAGRYYSPVPLEDLRSGDWANPNAEFAFYAALYRGLTFVNAGIWDEAHADFDFLMQSDMYDRLGASTHAIVLHLRAGDIDAAWSCFKSFGIHVHSLVADVAATLVRFRKYGDTAFTRRSLVQAAIMWPEVLTLVCKPVPNFPEDRHPSWYDTGKVFESLTGEAFDPLLGPSESYALYWLRTLWHETLGAREWAESVKLAGPSIEFDNGFLGQGPLLRVQPHDTPDALRCDTCGTYTSAFRHPIAILMDPDQTIVASVSGRQCNACNTHSISVDKLHNAILKKLPGSFGRDFIPFGFIRSEDLREKPSDFGVDEWTLANLRPWRKIAWAGEEFVEWPTEETTLEETKQMLKETGIWDRLHLDNVWAEA